MQASVRSFTLLVAFVCVLAAATAGLALAPASARADTVGVQGGCIDVFAPVTVADYNGAWRTSPVTVRFFAIDIGSGVAYTEYSVNGGATWVRGTSVTVSTPGVTTILYRSADIAGNLELNKSLNVRVYGAALYAGADSTLSGTMKIAGPLVNNQPSAAVYVNGKLTKASTVDLSKVALFVKAKGATVPPIAQFMPDSRIAALTAAAKVSPFNSATPKKNVTYSGSSNVTVTTPMTVNGNLSITGSGTYTFDAVYVTGSVAVTGPSSRFSFNSLTVGGSLSVTGGTALKLGPTYVAGNVALSGSGQWKPSLLVTGGSLAVAGTQTMGGDGTGTNPKSVTILMTGSGKGASITNTGTFYGLLCDRYGSVTRSGSTGAIKGSVVCGGSFTGSGGSTITYDAGIGPLALDATAPTTTAAQNPAANAAGWNNSAVTVNFAAVDDPGGSGVAATYYSVDGGAVSSGATANVPAPANHSGDGVHTVKYWSVDKAGNVETTKTATVRIDTTRPAISVAKTPDTEWSNGPVTVTAIASDALSTVDNVTWGYTGTKTASGTGTGVSFPAPSDHSWDGTYQVTFTVTDRAGNSQSTAASVSIDTTAPTGTMLINNGAALTTTPTVDLILTTSDGSGSGVTWMRFSDDGSAWGDWQAFSAATTQTLPGSAGDKTVYAQVKDAAGNLSSSFFATIKLVTQGTHTISASVTGTGGTISPSGDVTVNYGEDQTFTIAPQSGYHIADVVVDNVSVGNLSGYTFNNVVGNHVIAASFARLTYSLAYTADEHGAISGEAAQTVGWGGDGTAVTAEPEAGYRFVQWSDGGTANPRTDTNVKANLAVSASFARLTYSLAYTADEHGAISGEAAQTVGWGGDGTAVTAEPEAGYRFVQWSDGGTANPRTDTNVQANLAVSASFARLTYSLAYTADEHGAISGEAAQTVGWGGDGTAVTAEPEAGYRFVQWSDSGTANPRTDTNVQANLAVSASFARNPVVDAALEPAVQQPNGTFLIHYNRPVLMYSLKDDLGNPVQAASWEATLDDDLPLVSPLHPMPASGQPFGFALTSGDHKIVITGYDQAGNSYSETIRFTLVMAPFTIAPQSPKEGDLIGVYADATGATGNASGSWDGKTWVGSITRQGQEPFTFTGPVAFHALPTAAQYSVHLVTTDSTTGAVCVEDREFTAEERAPRVSALDAEIPYGAAAELFGRFLDPGWISTHTAEWRLTSPDGATVLTPQAEVSEDNVKAMDSGTVIGTSDPLEVVGKWHGELAVSTVGSNQEPALADFTIEVRPQRHQDDPIDLNDTTVKNNNSLPSASPVLDHDQTYLSYIQSAGDVDVYEIKTTGPSGSTMLPYGTEVLVNLVDLPADYDLALVEELGVVSSPGLGLGGTSFAASGTGEATWDSAKLVPRGPLNQSPFTDAKLVPRGPLAESPYTAAKLVPRGPLAESAYADAKLVPRGPLANMFFIQATSDSTSVDGYSFRDMSGTGVTDSSDSGSSVRFEELGLDNGSLEDCLIVGYSAHPGTTNETLLTKTDYVNGRIYVLVKGANDAIDASHPYTLRVETSPPIDLPKTMNAGSQGSVVVGGSDATETTEPLVQNPAPTTLYVTQAQRLDALYADPDDSEYQAFEDTIRPALEQIFDERPDDPACGDVISVPSVLYDDWDELPWSTELANQTAAAVRDEIQRYVGAHPSIKYVVLVGSDEIVPQMRVPDQTVTGNERAYADDSCLRASSPVVASMFDSMVLTDDPYVRLAPDPVQRTLALHPGHRDLAIGRDAG